MVLPLLKGRGARSEGGQKSNLSLQLRHASLHNLRDVSVEIPLSRFVCLTGVSGSGKTTLAREILLPLLSAKLNTQNSGPSDAKDADQGENDAEDLAAAADDALSHAPRATRHRLGIPGPRCSR